MGKSRRGLCGSARLEGRLRGAARRTALLRRRNRENARQIFLARSSTRGDLPRVSRRSRHDRRPRFLPRPAHHPATALGMPRHVHHFIDETGRAHPADVAHACGSGMASGSRSSMEKFTPSRRPQRIAELTEEHLRKCALGYRAKNLLATARLVAAGRGPPRTMADPLRRLFAFATLRIARGRRESRQLRDAVCLRAAARVSDRCLDRARPEAKIFSAEAKGNAAAASRVLRDAISANTAAMPSNISFTTPARAARRLLGRVICDMIRQREIAE